MSTRTITYVVCNGCGKNTLNDGIEIAQTKPYHYVPEIQETDPRTIDVCVECSEAGKYACQYCRQVHDDADPCEAVRLKMEEADRIMKEFAL